MTLTLLTLTQLAFSAGNIKSDVNISIMTYNLENLFDNKHDKGKEDWTWLPLKVKQNSKEVQAYCHSMTNDYYKRSCLELDWSDDILNKKIKNLSKVITQYNNGQGADIVVFQEVENVNILKELVDKGLKNLGYRYIALKEGPDTRGIDVGMISKIRVTSKRLYKINLKPHSHRTTRGILKVNFKHRNKRITVFANHWPSQGNNDYTRLKASEVLRDLTDRTRADLVVATGDFNTLHDDMPHGLNRNIYPIYEDVEEKARKVARIKAPGTHWYRGHWESLDKIFVLKKSLRKAKVNYKSFDILYHDFMLKDLEWEDFDTGAINFDEDIPSRFNTKTGEGFSDHLPVAVTISL
tara:strand:+ start:7766 stop:8821 length:1056 start_codon:yes stop_codon:yes gene_type:complete